MHIYFDNVEINQDYITKATMSKTMFNKGDSFTLGATPCTSMIICVAKESQTSTPDEVKIKVGENFIGTFIVDNAQDNGDEICYTLADKMVLFNFKYDASSIINNSILQEEGTKYVLLSTILQDICTKAGVTLATSTFTGSNKHISWYDSTITARDYIGFIAELNGGYAIVNKDGELEIKSFSNETSKQISIDDVGNYQIGEYHKITKVVYDIGTQKWEYGNENNDTLYINTSNTFVTEASDIQNIYNIINNIEFNSFTTQNCEIFENWEIGDCIELTQNGSSIYTFAQADLEYNGGWNGGYSFEVNTSKQDETNVIASDKENIKSLKTEINRQDAILTIQAEEVDELQNKTAQLQVGVDQINTKITNIANITTSGETTFASLNLANVNASSPVSIKIRPIEQSISYLYPSSTLYPSNTTYLKNRTLRFHNNTTNENFDWVLPTNLNYTSESLYDELVLSYETMQVIVNRNVGGTQSSETYDFPLSLVLTDGDYTVTLLGYNKAYLYVTLMASNIYTTQFPTKVEMNSAITQTAEEINATVSQKADKTEVTSAINQKADEITSTVSSTYATKDTTNTLSSRISQTAKDINLSVTNNGTTSGITITTTKEDGTTEEVTSGTIEMNGLVKFTDLSTNGRTTIHGGNIQTGTLSASKITTGTLNASNVNITNLKANNITTGTINGIPYVSSADSSSGTVKLGSSDGPIVGYNGNTQRWSIAAFTTGGRFQTFDSTGSLACYFNHQKFQTPTNSGAYLDKTGVHNTSDIRYKENISNIEEKTSMDIISNLTPIEYTYKNSNDYHRGLSAQEVERILNSNNIKEEIYEVDETGKYSLNYIELIPDLINCIKMLQKEIEELKKESEEK